MGRKRERRQLAVAIIVFSVWSLAMGTSGEENPRYTSLGCWGDSGDRAIPTLEGTDPRLDGHYSTRQDPIGKCYQVARSRGFTVFAVQNGGWCAGSANGHTTYNKHGASTGCGADGEGGGMANEVYQITGCSMDYVRFNGVCYKSFRAWITRDEARQACEADGAMLAMPKDSETNAFLASLPEVTGGRWLGVTDTNADGQWVLEDGQTLTYSNWKNNEPNDGNICASFYSTIATWDSRLCSHQKGYICQRNEGRLHIVAKSHCKSDPGFNDIDTSYVEVNGLRSYVAYGEYRRGHNAFIINEVTGVVENSEAFDTYGDSSAPGNVLAFLEDAPSGRILVVLVHDSGNNQPNLTTYGATTLQLGSRECWAMITQKGQTPAWFVEGSTGLGLGPTYIETNTRAELVGFWPLNAEHGASDVTGNGNDAVAIGTQLALGPYGNLDGAYLFSGTATSYLDIPNNGELDVRYSFTILAHIYPTGQAGPIFSYVVENNGFGPHLWQTAAQQMFIRVVERDPTTALPSVAENVLQQNAWNYVGGSYNSATGTATLWNNGEVVGEVHVGVAEVETRYPVRVAVRDGDSRYFAGRIACVQLYNYAMTAEQVAAARDRCEGQFSVTAC
ncbi:uncharacterized protein LOC118416147 [Branchiostoma floridae]|uniref:Uncharacterized protein LOC118416147 n=1 Tax=Branchiostoma floridae TaxID=7739 RepID=A0A9J7MS98_BRAFL|nr:uncharacterized protein LOC118416147 [Branchiostoma floridae]